MSLFPTLFISHGAPDLALADTEAAGFLRGLAQSFRRPKAIVVASAHFEASPETLVSVDAEPETIHDFGGFDPRLHQIHYEAPGEPALGRAIVELLREEGFDADPVSGRGFDHGTWVPLSLVYPTADIPVVQVSVNPERDAKHHFALGQALAALRERDVLLIGSGSFTHNLREAFQHVRSGERGAATPDWVSGFADWMDARIVDGDTNALLDYRERAPFAQENHPTDEHLMPLFVAMGAAGPGNPGRRLHDSRDFGVLAMSTYAFD